MIEISGLRLPLSYTEADLRRAAARRLGVKTTDLLTCRLHRRSVDARKKPQLVFEITVGVTVKNETAVLAACRQNGVKRYEPTVFTVSAPKVKPAHRPVVVGSGPAGLFAALRVLDDPAVTKVYARCPEGGGIAYAVQNRLKKAAAFQIIDPEETV